MPVFVPIRELKGRYEAAGLTVNVLPGAETRGARLYASGYESLRGFDKHHTAQSLNTTDDNSIAYLTFNNPYRSAMCNVYPHRDDPFEITICAAGPTYTAGSGGPIGTIPAGRGNKHGWSWECPNNGVGEPWPEALQDTMVVGSAVEIEFFQQWEHANLPADPFSQGSIFAHFEWAPGRKIDPSGPSRYTAGRNTMWDMDLFRADVRHKHRELYLIPPPTIPPHTETSTNMVLWTSTGRRGTFLLGAGIPILLTPSLVDWYRNADDGPKLTKINDSSEGADARWDDYLALFAGSS